MHIQQWVDHLMNIYGDKKLAETIVNDLQKRLASYVIPNKKQQNLDQHDAVLITYGDSINKEREYPLKTLYEFLEHHVGDAISTVHILPFFPYSSDDGFSVIDYLQVNPQLGSWEDIKKIASHYSLMVDAVVNHASRESQWFAKYLNCEKPYDQFFITCDPKADYHTVTRPRALPLLTKYKTVQGDKYVWTTFSEDQIDLNYRCPELLERIIEIILTYTSKGARFIRLDAIGFIWKNLETNCINQKQAHEIIKLIHLILQDYAPGTMLISETNVPEKDNLSYFGSGDEANMVYQFPLPPLVMHTFLTGDSTKLTAWAKRLPKLKQNTTFFNFLSSHDGIGLRPIEGILSKTEQDYLVATTLENGGNVSYKDNGNGTQSPYELNINYQDALTHTGESDETRISKFCAAETILLSLQGLPAIYIHSLLGSRNDYKGRDVSGITRRINREKLSLNQLEQELTHDTNRKKIFDALIHLLKIRQCHTAFSPASSQNILSINSQVFALERHLKDEKVLVVVNVTDNQIELKGKRYLGIDLLSDTKATGRITLKPFQASWILTKTKELI